LWQDLFRLGRPKQTNKISRSLKFQHILIITYGRSGSTLLQGVLNGIDGVVLRGENDNVFFDLYKTYEKLVQLKRKRVKSVEPTRPWYGICLIDESALLAQYQEMAKVILLADQYDNAEQLTYGFKEIRYNDVGEEFDDYLDFLYLLFPSAAFIFNTRDHESVASSGWWKDEERSSVTQALSTMDARFSAYAADKDHCFSIRYEDLVAQGEPLRDLFSFLGAPYNSEEVATILNIQHSYSPEQEEVKNMDKR